MTTADGTVLNMAQVFGNAPRHRAFNVVLLAEGFTAAQQHDFDTACIAFVTTLWATPPFDDLAQAINVFRVNVASTDSGADDPVTADGGTGATARTYFDAAFGRNRIRRMLGCNATTALQVATVQLPEYTPGRDVILIIVNSTIFGGSGGSVGTYSLALGATDIALHEMGHTAFHLADEYAYFRGGHEPFFNHYAGDEPTQPNVTTHQDRHTLKWRWAVAEATAIPTMRNLDCSTVNGSPSPVPPGTAGLFEGAYNYHCGVFRPEYSCKMQQIHLPFCRVCRQVIVDRIGSLVT